MNWEMGGIWLTDKEAKSIKREKLDSLKNAAEEYLYIHTEWKYIQFDVVAIMLHYNAPPEYFLIEDIYF